MLASRPTLVSESEFLALPETMDRIELLDGEVIVSPSPSVWHQELLSRLVQLLRSWAAQRGERVFVGHSPLDVRFAPGRILQPDAFVILDELAWDHEGPIDRVPDLCIEVLSTNRVYDRLTKRFVYAAAGVRELWLIEPSGSIERWSGEGLDTAEVLTASLTSPLLPGLTVDLATLFRR
ncbi:MAG TPA: Uma2 family endonuclease [Thermoanaerobaculia bacterium]|jgi:Uma2 family endonuclease|nr:Uma2 family endonuclease [Thermoanaerobaculia bacterium]